MKITVKEYRTISYQEWQVFKAHGFKTAMQPSKFGGDFFLSASYYLVV